MGRRVWTLLRYRGVVTDSSKPKPKNIGVMFAIQPAHYEAIRAEAFRRAEVSGSNKPGLSEVVREILDAWLAAQEPNP